MIMTYSKVIHVVSIITGIWGALALIGAWLAGENGTILGLTQQHCYNDAIVLTLISISAGICAMYRNQLEKEAQ